MRIAFRQTPCHSEVPLAHGDFFFQPAEQQRQTEMRLCFLGRSNVCAPALFLEMRILLRHGTEQIVELSEKEIGTSQRVRAIALYSPATTSFWLPFRFRTASFRSFTVGSSYLRRGKWYLRIRRVGVFCVCERIRFSNSRSCFCGFSAHISTLPANFWKVYFRQFIRLVSRRFYGVSQLSRV